MLGQQTDPKSQIVSSDDTGRANAPTERVRSFILGHDVFISYSRADAVDYAPRLANQLTKLGFRCYLDQLDAPPGEKTSEPVITALRHSSSLVIVGSQRAAASVEVGREVELFSKLNRLIIPIDVDDALEDAVWNKTIAGLPKVPESGQAVEKGRPSRQVLSRIYDSAKFRRRNKQLKTAALAVLAAVVLVVIVGGGLSIFFAVMAKIARDNQQDAEVTRQTAVADAENAQKLKTEAEQGLGNARAQLAIATIERAMANGQTDAAKAETQVAQLMRAQSEQQVRKQRVIAESLDLANAATRKLDADRIADSTKDAIASAKRLSTVNERAVESDRALRRTLALFPNALAAPRSSNRPGRVRDVAFSSDARQFIILNNDLSVELYNRDGNLPPRQLLAKSTTNKNNSSGDVAVSNDLKRWAVKKNSDSWVEVREIEGSQSWRVDIGQTFIYDLIISPDGRYLVTVSSTDAQIWSVEENRKLASLVSGNIQSVSLQSARFSSDGRIIVVGGKTNLGKADELRQGRIYIWREFGTDKAVSWQQKDFDANREEMTLSGDDRMDCFTVTNDANSFATCSGKVWIKTTEGLFKSIAYLPMDDLLQEIAFDPTGQSVSTIKLRLKKESLLKVMVTGGYDEDFDGWLYEVWASSGYSTVASIPSAKSLTDLRFDRKSKTLLTVGEPTRPEEGLVRYWSMDRWVEQEDKRLGMGGSFDDIKIKKTIGGRFVATVQKVLKFNQNHDVERRITIDIWDLMTRKKVRLTFEKPCFPGDELLLSGDGNTLAFTCGGGDEAPAIAIYRRRADTFTFLKNIEIKDDEELNSLSPDGKFFVLSEEPDERDTRSRLVSVDSGKEKNPNFFDEAFGTKTAFSPNSKFVSVLYGQKNGTGLTMSIAVLRLSDGKKLAEIKGDSGLMYESQFSPDSRYLAAVSLDGTVSLVDLSRKNPQVTELNFVEGAVETVFEEGSRLLAVLTENAIEVIDLSSARAIAEIPVEERVGNVAFSHDLKYVAAAVPVSGNKEHRSRVQIWHLSPKELLNEAIVRLSHVQP